MNNFYLIVLAAGKGTRMGGTRPKVLRTIAGKPIIYWCLDLFTSIGMDNIIVVVGYKSADVIKKISSYGFKVEFIKQNKQLGTAHSVRVALKTVPEKIKNVFVVFGDDSALYTKKTIKDFISCHLKNRSKATLMITKSGNSQSVGGLEINKKGQVVGVLQRGKEIRGGKKIVVLCGAFCFQAKWIKEFIHQVPKTKSSGEFPLPGIIAVAKMNKVRVNTFLLKNKIEWNSVNTTEELRQSQVKKMSLLKL
ncbi:MAG: NTP transferase domain-containing protein [Patescibacteria group bacterium]